MSWMRSVAKSEAVHTPLFPIPCYPHLFLRHPWPFSPPTQDGNLDLAAVEAALDRITAVMQEHRLFLDVVTFPTRCDKAEWTLWMDGDLLIGKGEAAVQEEILCSAFFSGQKNVLKHTGYYPGPRGD